MTIALLGILGVIISMVVGMLWYSLKTPMGKLQMEATGHGNLSEEEQRKRMDAMKPQMWKYFIAQAVLALLTSLFIAFIMIEQKGLGVSVIFGEVGAAWLCFTVPIIGQSLLWGNVDQKLRWKKLFSDSLANLVTYFLIILIFSFIVH
jgi:tellurite resistance protein TehA-like permease